MNWINNIRTTALLVAIIILIKPTAGLVLQTSKDKGYYECEYSSLPYLSFEWAQVPKESMGLTASLTVYQPSKLYGEINANTWYKSTNGSSMLDKEEEKIRFNINAGTVDVLDSKTGFFETVQLTDPTRLVSYIPHANRSSSPLEIPLPNPGFYCVQVYYEISDTSSYTLTDYYYDEIKRKDIRYLKYYGPSNRTRESDKQFFQAVAGDYLPRLNFYDSQYRAIFKDFIVKSRFTVLSCLIWPSTVIMVFASFFIKRSAVKRQVLFYASFGLSSTAIFLIKWGITAYRYSRGPEKVVGGIIFVDTLDMMLLVLLIFMVCFGCICLFTFSIKCEKNQDGLDEIHLFYLGPLGLVYFMMGTLAELSLILIHDTNLISGAVIGGSCKSFQDTTIIITSIGCLIVLATSVWLITRENILGEASWLAKFKCDTSLEQSRLAIQTSLLYKTMPVFGLIYAVLYGVYIFDTRNYTTIAALDSLIEYSWVRMLHVDREFCWVLIYMWTGVCVLFPLMFKEAEHSEDYNIPLVKFKAALPR
ncbi:hypothetical protein WICPIJ_004572 [Wickerhamomyces pijperi]|uniref:Uncharacterized protein n=1 Tax=Wickerhamomyces pijperi TaxID=599730 RepID=A0A9P8Q5A7_WICPI|nr:hypothetical protein WICPIJ_004572 [Wickerhamomyces pijperi]